MKKIISILTAVVLLMSMSVVAFAIPTDTQTKKAAEQFSPFTFKAVKAAVAPTIDGEKEVLYDDSSEIIIEGFTTYDGLSGDSGASGRAYVMWDANNLYIYVDVDDASSGIGGGHTADSVEIYLDYDQAADGKKEKWDSVSSSVTYSAQYRVQRGEGSKLELALGSNPDMGSVAKRTKTAVVEKTGGYIVEVSMPLKDESGAYLPVSGTIGFELQINDSIDGMNRTSAAYIQGGIQYYAYQYSNLFDNIKLDGCDIAWTRPAPDTNPTNPFETKPSSGGDKGGSDTGTTTSKNTSSNPSSKPSSTPSSKPSSNPSSAPSSAVSSEVSSEAETSSVVEKENKEEESDIQTDETIGAIGGEDIGEDKEGLSTPIIIAIVAGGVLLLAAAAVAVIFILKKKGAKAEVTAEETPAEETPEE